MKPYPKYKPSGIEWLGNVPDHWEVKKYKYSAFVVNGYPFDSKKFNPSEGHELIRIRDIESTSTEMKYLGEWVNEATINFGDVVIGMDGDFNIAKWKGKRALLNQRVCKVEGNGKLNNNFLYYLLPATLKTLNDLTYFTTVKHLSSNDILDSTLPLPPLPEQQAIASFLDEKTKQIDTLIEKKQKLIELLKEERQAVINEAVTKGINPEAKMKPSGIEWLGDIPEHWEVKKIKYICKIQGRVGFKGYQKSDLVEEGKGALTIGAKHISKNDMLDLSSPDYLSWEKYYESPEIMVGYGDILMTQRGTLGKVMVIDREIGPATINPSMVLVKKLNAYNRFLYYFLKSSYTTSIIDLVASSTAVPMISQETIENMRCLIPPIEEQKVIALYLDEMTIQLEMIRNKAEKEIELLQEYRTALIAEVVTGKVCVTNN